MKRWVQYLLGGIVLLVAVGAWQTFSSPLLISADEARERLRRKQFDLVLDVRTDAEVALTGAHPGSKHIPSGELDRRVDELPNKNARILVYCNTGQRARAAAEKLQRFGYPNVRYIAGPHTTLH